MVKKLPRSVRRNTRWGNKTCRHMFRRVVRSRPGRHLLSAIPRRVYGAPLLSATSPRPRTNGVTGHMKGVSGAEPTTFRPRLRRQSVSAGISCGTLWKHVFTGAVYNREFCLATHPSLWLGRAVARRSMLVRRRRTSSARSLRGACWSIDVVRTRRERHFVGLRPHTGASVAPSGLR